MPRPKKGSAEAKAKMAKARSARLKPQPSVASSEETIDALMKRIEELEKAKFPFAQGPQITPHGVVGVVTKYVVDPKHYPDPRPGLWKHMQSTPALRSYGFTEDNYEMKWEVGVVNYQTIDGTNIKEPRFRVELWGILYDDATGQPNKKYKIHELIFHEDPQAAIQIAHEKGLAVDESLQKDFLDEMRFLRVRDWLLDRFIDPKYNEKKEKRSEEVIGNRLVDVIEISSGETSAMPFGEITNRL